MKVKIKKQNNLLNVEKDGFTLEGISNGFYHYKMHLSFNFSKVLKEKSFEVTLLGRDKAYEKVETKLFPSFNADLIVKEVQTQRPVALDLARSTKIDAFYKQSIDLTKFFPKTAISSVQNAFDKSSIKKKTLKPLSVLDLNSKNSVVSVLEKNVSSNLVSSTTTATNLSLKSEMNNILYSIKKDPAEYSTPTFSITSAKSSNDGTIPRQPGKLRSQTNSLTESGKNVVVGSLLNNKNISSMRDLDLSSILMVPVEEETYFLTGVFDILIPVGDINTENFYFTLLHHNKDGVIQGIYNYNIPHLRNIENLNIPTEAPTIEVLPRVNNNFIDLALKQNDENATQIYLYRKQVQKDVNQAAAIFVEVGRYSAQKSDGFVRVLDVLPTQSPTIYRAVPVGSNGVMGAEFSSAFVDVDNRFALPRQNRQTRPTTVSINASSFSNGIKLEIKDLPAGPIAWCVLRKNLSTFEQDYTRISNIFQVKDEGSSSYSYEDQNVNLNKIYDYKIQMIYKDGLVVDTSNSFTIPFKPVSNNVVNTTILSPTIVQVGNDYDTTFSISSEIIPEQLDLVKSALISQGLTEFVDAVQADRNQLQKLFAYKVERFNVTTGELEDFGVIRNQSFSDLKYQKNVSAKSLEPGNRYQYKVTTFLRATDSLISSIRTTVSGAVNGSYTFQPYKWKHPLALNEGIISTEESRKRNYSQSDFSFGDVVDITTTTVSLADNVPNIEQAFASKISNSKVLISWNVKGSLKKIDHFIVILDILGMRTVVGKSHSLGNVSYFRFLDKLTNNETGALTYYIIPVFYDQSRGSEIKTNTVVVE